MLTPTAVDVPEGDVAYTRDVTLLGGLVDGDVYTVTSNIAGTISLNNSLSNQR